MDRRRTGDVLFYALQCAVRDRQTYAEAVAHCGDGEHAEALKDIAAFRRLSRQLFGTDRSRLEALMDNARTVSVTDLRKQLTQDSDS